ncbi:HIT domain-containing protein [Rathayibacter sp. VKM Ac-2803]|uniref:HIT family protein n=1 Tax=Rathayibacter sp. VKM Ac-2803 TaxID=2609256 RepID=UPI001357EA66|nr:HIT domain-containing protein [Rathayibacter sp. VKM Ac-2803]MWV50078.1 HIT domain-containing protein [Rathayibacter sp. VKM Ac-2803]
MIGRAGCPFCERISREDYDLSWLNAVSFEPLNPVTPGHRLFVTRTHHSPLSDPFERIRDWKPGQEMYPAGVKDVLPLLTNWRHVNRITEPYNLILNAGAEASQTIEHLHLHYIPRREGDGLMLPWTSAPTPEEATRD